MPAEWVRHEGTWLQWPHDDCYAGQQRKLERTWLDMLDPLCQYETVHITVQDERRRDHLEHQLEFYGVDRTNVDINIIPTNDVWTRDNGPIFVIDGEGNLAITHWRFNGWGRFPHDLDKEVPGRIARAKSIPVFAPPLVLEGGAIEVNGKGTLMATRSSIMNSNRNPGKSQAEIEEILGSYLGVEYFIWLSGAEAEACESWGDTTDFHVDIAARFVNESTVLYNWAEDESDPRHPYFKRHHEELKVARTESGRPLELIPLPTPRNGVYRITEDLHGCGTTNFTDAAYSNYYIGNGVVLVPVFGNVNDEAAKEIIGGQFPGRQVVGIDAVSLNEEGGAMHCVTQQQPAA